MLRSLSAGESHGRALLAILEGMPAGLRVDEAFINRELKRRQSGFGRGRRMQIEHDKVEILSGLKNRLTLGSPLGIVIRNRDYSIERLAQVLSPRPGHADLAGYLKYGFRDIREVLERASARSTAATVAVGALCKTLLGQFDISIRSRVICVGGSLSAEEMAARVREAIRLRDTVGGIFQVTASGVPAGLGSYAQPDRRLDGRLAGALVSIPGVKAVEFGLGFGYADVRGSQCHDAIYYRRGKGYLRRSNNAGGIEGGISNGEDIVMRGCMKPIATLGAPLESVNVRTRKASPASVQRSDICVVEAAGVVAESAVAFVLADLFLEKFGSDNLSDIRKSYQAYRKRIR